MEFSAFRRHKQTTMPHVTTYKKICFIGGGNMGSAIIAGLLQNDAPWNITVCDLSGTIRDRHAAQGLAVSATLEPCSDADVVVLAVKPQVAPAVMTDLGQWIQDTTLVISIMAGVTIASMEKALASSCPIVRSMPNTPMAIGCGMIGLSPSHNARAEDLQTAENIFSYAGKTLQVAEEQLNALTAVSGSGPAYLFRIAEAQLSAALKLGFNQEQAQLLVGQTLLGSVRYLLEQDGFPASQLREQVTSPGGTTAAGLACMETIDGIFDQTYKAACQRGDELAALAALKTEKTDD